MSMPSTAHVNLLGFGKMLPLDKHFIVDCALAGLILPYCHYVGEIQSLFKDKKNLSDS